MFDNLQQALKENNISIEHYYSYLGISKRSLYYRFSGKREFTLNDIELTSELLPGRKWEDLFKR